MSLNLEKDEYIVFEVRKHWFTLIFPAILVFFAALIPVFIYSFFSILPVNLVSEYNLTILFLFLYVNWVMVLWVISFVIWTDHYLDVWIITNKNLIDIEQQGIFNRDISTTRLSRIQDITSEVRGMFQTFLNFGDLTIQTAGVDRQFTISGIENPVNVRENLEKAITQYNKTIEQSTL